MSVDINEFHITKIEAGVADAVEALNVPLYQIEDDLNALVHRIADISTKSAVIRKNVPMSATVFPGALVYYNAGNARFEPALAQLMGEPGVQGNSVEAPSSRVEGMVLSKDPAPDIQNSVQGTLLIGGYWEDKTENLSILSGCLGEGVSKPGTYYLSPVNAGMAVSDTNGHLRQPVLSNYGDGKFSLSMFYMAHDNHFHASCALDGSGWTAVSTPPPAKPDGTPVTVPDGATLWYNGVTDSGYINMGELSPRTTAVFYNGILQNPETDDFIVSDIYLWYKGAGIPENDKVVVFNDYPFAYDSAVVRSVESTNSALTVVNRNGIIQLTANDFEQAGIVRNGYAVSNIAGNRIVRTPVLSGAAAGPGVVLNMATNGVVTISASSKLNTPIDAYAVNYNQTNSTSDGVYTYFTYPKGRVSSLSIMQPVTDVADTTTLNARVWCDGVGSGTTFTVSIYWIPQPTIGIPGTISTATPALVTTLSFSGASSNALTYAETAKALEITGSGLLTAVVATGNTAPQNDIKLLRIGFRLELVSAETATSQSTDITKVTSAITNTINSAASIPKFRCIYADSNGRAVVCTSQTPDNSDRCIGVTIADPEYLAGTYELTYILQGVITDNSAFSGMTPGDALFVGTTGEITNVDPSADENAAFIQRIGTVLSATSAQIFIEAGILKA